MSDTFDPEDYENLQERTRNVPARQIKVWEQQAKRIAELEAREAARERTAALAEAGIPSEFGALFRDDAPIDTLKAAFEKFGGASAPNTTQQSLAGHEAASAMASGAQGASTSDMATQLEAMRFEARNRTNWRGYGGEAKTQKDANALNSMLAREGITPHALSADLRPPGQLGG